MTRRYIAFYEWYPDAKDSLAKTIYEPEAGPVKTGLLDAYGTPLFRIDEPEPIGFIHLSKRGDK